jgi:hypothetical protein
MPSGSFNTLRNPQNDTESPKPAASLYYTIGIMIQQKPGAITVKLLPCTELHYQFKAVANHNGPATYEVIYLPFCRGKPRISTPKDHYGDNQIVTGQG